MKEGDFRDQNVGDREGWEQFIREKNKRAKLKAEKEEQKKKV